tara:strand:- start:246 stop:509 length:264 start_codon:yes stop_codon:yes gene_type:complete
MLKKIKNIFYLLSFFVFATLIVIHYFSNENVVKVNKNRILYSSNVEHNINDLPLLENDTNNIIEYKNDIEVYKKNKKKYSFWGLLEK